MNRANGVILNIPPEQVVDRDEYIKKINEVILYPDSSNVIFLTSESAIGKSALVDKLLSNSALTQEVIRVKTLPKNKSEKIEEWEYLSNLFTTICNKYQGTDYSFEEYIYSSQNNTNKKDIWEYTIDMLLSEDTDKWKSKFFRVAIYLMAKQFLKLGKFGVDSIIQDKSIRGMRIKAQYIKYIIYKSHFIISIDNIQNIDKESLRELINLINETSALSPQFILEYTSNKGDDSNAILGFADNFTGTPASIKIFSIEKLRKEYIVDAISKHIMEMSSDWSFNLRLQEKYEKEDSGNIREMIDYCICYQHENTSDSSIETNESLNNILSLPDASKQLLSIIVCANNSIDISILQRICAKINLDMKMALEPLQQRLILEVTQDGVELSHASLSDVWRESNTYFEHFDNSSQRYLEEEYTEIIKTSCNSDIRDHAWVKLIQLYGCISPEKLARLFSHIDSDFRRRISRESAWKYIDKIVQSTWKNLNAHYDLYLNIIRYCFESELYSEGYSILLKVLVSHENEILILYKAMYLSALDRHVENIVYCKEMENYFRQTRTYYNLRLISLASYRSLNQLDKCKEIHNELIKDKAFKKLPEYGYFLRLCEMYLDRNKSPRYLRKSVYVFEKASNPIQAGKSLISYSYILASQGKLKRATKMIEKAEKYLTNKRMGIHMFLVNQAAIRLLSGDYSDGVWEILSESEVTAVVPFDKLAIISNKLVWCCENPSSNRHKLLIKYANDLLDKEPDKHIHGLVYYNIYYLLNKLKDPEAEIYFKKAVQMKPYCKPLKARLDNAITVETKFALTKPWHVCFLAYWTYDLQTM